MQAGRKAYQKKNYRQALAQFELAALFLRTSPIPHLWRAQCLLKLKMKDGAHCCALKALRLSPKSRAAKMLLSHIPEKKVTGTINRAPLLLMEQAILDGWMRKKGFKEATLRSFGRYPIHTAALNGDLETARYLLRSGASLHSLDDKGKASPLHWAILGNKLEFVSFLIDEGIDLDIRNEAGESGLHYAASADNIGIAALLIKSGCPIDCRDRDGNSPLHVAALTASCSFITLLIENGADKEARNISNERPLDRALSRGREEAAKLLR